MDHTESLTISLEPEEYALLLDTVITALGTFHVVPFHEHDSESHTAFARRQQLMESILRKLCSVKPSTQRAGEKKEEAPALKVKGKAA